MKLIPKIIFLLLLTACSTNDKNQELQQLFRVTNYLIQDHNSFQIAHNKMLAEYKSFIRHDLIFTRDSSSFEYRKEHLELRDEYKQMIENHRDFLVNHKDLVEKLTKMKMTELAEQKITQLSDSLAERRAEAVNEHKEFMQQYLVFSNTHQDLLMARRLDKH